MSRSVIGWTTAWISGCPEATLTEERKKALVERIRKRGYNFTHDSHYTLPYCAPVYEDGTYCILTKPQWDEVMAEAYGEMPRGSRLMPYDVISFKPINDILYEKEKFIPKDGDNNG